MALADELGVARQTVTRWHREPGNPGKRSDGRYEVSAWRKFLRNRPAYGGGPDGYRERCRRIELQNQKLEWEIAQLQRQYVPIKDVEKWSQELRETITGIVTGSLTCLAPELRLCSVPDAESRLKDVEDRILTRLHALGGA